MGSCAACRVMLRHRLNVLRQQLRSGPRRRWQSTSSDSAATAKTIEPTRPARAQDQVPTPGNIGAPALTVAQRFSQLKLLQWYGRAHQKRPNFTQFCVSLVIYFCGDVSAQAIGGREYGPLRTLRSLVIGGIAAVPGWKWFLWLQNNFNYQSRALSIAVKVVVNQIVFAPTFNTYFFGMQGLLVGDSPEELWERVKKTVPVSCLNSCKLWPAVTALNLAFVPLAFRQPVAGTVAVGWQTYLSYLNRRAEEQLAARAQAAAKSPRIEQRQALAASA